MKILVSLLSLSLLSFTSPERAFIKLAPKMNLKTAPPSDSLSLKNLRIAFKRSDNNKGISSDKSIKKSISKALTGTATYYAKYFEGLRAANGEIFSHAKPNVASNFFKLNSWVRVTNVKNGKSIIARVTDRMHPKMAARGRVVDVTSNHAKALGIYGSGMAKVKIEEVEPGTQE